MNEIVEAQTNEIETTAGFHTKSGFELTQRAAQLLASSTLVPKEFQGDISNCSVALELAQRMNASPLMVMQNIYIVHGRPGWSAKFIIAAINQTRRFSSLRYEFTEAPEGSDGWGCRAWAVEHSTGERLDGPWITLGLAKSEGWYQRSGSKWKTIPDLMVRYRAGAWWGNTYAPEITMGLPAADELEDRVIDITPTGSAAAALDAAAAASDAPVTTTPELPAAKKPRKKKPEPEQVTDARPSYAAIVDMMNTASTVAALQDIHAHIAEHENEEQRHELLDMMMERFPETEE